MVQHATTRRWLALATLVVGAAWGCGDDDNSDSPNNVAGSAGQGGGGAGGDGLAGAGGTGGEGTTEPGCIEHSTCDIWGANFGCPATVDDVLANCGFAVVERYESSCGGVYIEASNGAQLSEWTFDSDGKLIGTTSVGDQNDCDYWGTRCEPVGQSRVLCGIGGAQGIGGDGGDAGMGGHIP